MSQPILVTFIFTCIDCHLYFRCDRAGLLIIIVSLLFERGFTGNILFVLHSYCNVNVVHTHPQLNVVKSPFFHIYASPLIWIVFINNKVTNIMRFPLDGKRKVATPPYWLHRSKCRALKGVGEQSWGWKMPIRFGLILVRRRKGRRFKKWLGRAPDNWTGS